MSVRYGARQPEQQRNRELEATQSGEIWSQAITAIYETDPEIIAASSYALLPLYSGAISGCTMLTVPS